MTELPRARAPAPAKPGVPPNRRTMAALVDRYWGILLFLPSFLLVAAIVVYPLARGIALSFFYYVLNRPDRGTPFVGLKNFVNLMHDPVFWVALKNTVVWVVAGVTLQFAVGLLVALALNRRLWGKGVVQTVVLLPWVMPTVVAAYMWTWLYDGQLGVLNDLLLKIGWLHKAHPWLADPHTALLSGVLVSLWKEFPFFTLFLLAGLQNIVPELHEAAAVDGAGIGARFWNITMPLLRPSIVTAVILRVIGMVNSPDILLVLTRGGPGQATQILPLYTFTTAYESFNFGYAAAISVVMLVILLAFTVVYFKVSRVGKEAG